MILSHCYVKDHFQVCRSPMLKEKKIEVGRPTPCLDISQSCKGGFIRRFSAESYNRI